eukprot:scaffold53344_cov21-Tisochrysis_lutea.AAC.1
MHPVIPSSIAALRSKQSSLHSPFLFSSFGSLLAPMSLTSQASDYSPRSTHLHPCTGAPGLSCCIRWQPTHFAALGFCQQLVPK